MKMTLLALSMLFAGACNTLVSDPSATSPSGSARRLPPPNPLAVAVQDHSMKLLAQINAVDALAQDPILREDSLSNADEAMLIAAWPQAAENYRAQVAADADDLNTTDSLRRVHLAHMDSLTSIVAATQARVEGVVRAAELRRIDAKLAPGGSFRFQGAQYSAIRLDPHTVDIQLHWKNAAGSNYASIGHLKSDLEKQGESVVMITNAGMYNPDNSPQGLFIEDGKELVPLDTTSGPDGRLLNFYMMPNGVFFIGKNGPQVVVTEDFPKSRKDIQFATQSGPMLVIDGKIHPKFNKGSSNTNIRSGVGITRDHQVVFVISDRPVNFYDFATLFKEALHCDNALYLDGAISQMYLPNSNRTDLGGDFGPILAITKK
jgi:uncharacterized protein YigE (DUF2233 family)